MYTNPAYMSMVAQELRNNRLSEAKNERLVRQVQGKRASLIIGAIQQLQTMIISGLERNVDTGTYEPQQSCCCEMVTN